MVATLITPDGRYLVVDGRLWRTANPDLSEEVRAELTAELMRARRAVGTALRHDDAEAERVARREVNRAKIALGERGVVWWDDGAPDFNRRLVRNTPYLQWYEQALQFEAAIQAMLSARASHASICPSEIARELDPHDWRKRMPEVREAARRLARRGIVTITQKGKACDPDTEWRGPVRISFPSE